MLISILSVLLASLCWLKAQSPTTQRPHYATTLPTTQEASDWPKDAKSRLQLMRLSLDTLDNIKKEFEGLKQTFPELSDVAQADLVFNPIFDEASKTLSPPFLKFSYVRRYWDSHECHSVSS